MEKGISVVIPAFNAANWLQSTTEKLINSIRKADISKFEIIIVDDGSTDQTSTVLQQLSEQYGGCIVVLSHENSGRFVTRKRGVLAAKYPRILFLDTRVWLDELSLAFLSEQLEEYPRRQVWNGHINVAKKGNIIARFGDALTLIGWRRYFKHPKLSSFGVKDFDYFPKGTGLFSAPKSLLIEAMEWFESMTTDIRNSSDDTLLIRHIAEKEKIWISPEFSALYHARTTLGAFIKHSFYRGQFFVDGFLRKDTRFFWPLIIFLVATFPVVVVILVYPVSFLPMCALWVAGFVAALILGLSVMDSFALFLLSPLFTIAYGFGIWRAVIRRTLR